MKTTSTIPNDFGLDRPAPVTRRRGPAHRVVDGPGGRVASVHVDRHRGALQDVRQLGRLFGHDKVEGVATTNGGKTLYLSNDDDFGVDTIAVAPDGLWTVHQKVLPALKSPN
jgi:hypothetical protein